LAVLVGRAEVAVEEAVDDAVDDALVDGAEVVVRRSAARLARQGAEAGRSLLAGVVVAAGSAGGDQDHDDEHRQDRERRQTPHRPAARGVVAVLVVVRGQRQQVTHACSFARPG